MDIKRDEDVFIYAEFITPIIINPGKIYCIYVTPSISLILEPIEYPKIAIYKSADIKGGTNV